MSGKRNNSVSFLVGLDDGLDIFYGPTGWYTGVFDMPTLAATLLIWSRLETT